MILSSKKCSCCLYLDLNLEFKMFVALHVITTYWDLNLEFQMLVALRVITKSE